MSLVLERIGHGSHMMITGDLNQTDLKNKKESGVAFLPKLIMEIEGFAMVELKQNHRHPIVQNIVDVYKKYNN